MEYFWQKIKKQARRFGLALVVFGVASAILAYFLGYYDLSFLDRYKLLMDPVPTKSEQPFSSFLPIDYLSDSIGQPTETVSAHDITDESTDLTPDDSNPAWDQPAGETKSVLSIADTSKLADVLPNLPLTTDLTGYVPTDEPYDGTNMQIAKLAFNYKLPEKFSLRNRVSKSLSYIIPEEDAPYIAEYTSIREERPAIELYMGYILLDNRDSLYLIDSDGNALCSFSDNVYHPAYTRDRENRPLFYRETEDGDKLYFYLSEDGRSFVRSDYDEILDSRGLYFDYPAYWGVTDNASITIDLDKTSGRYAYLTEEGRLTSYTFTNAFAYAGGRACVTSTSGRGGMYFIDESGSRVQNTFVTYLRDEYARYAIWDYVMPASDGVENLGFFYYDHGLVRVRYQIIDYWPWSRYKLVRIVSDTDELIRTDGSIYDLPVGYTLKGYSEGMILLEKDGLYGFMDYTGGWIAEPCYISATPFISGLAVLETADGRFGVIDREGNIILPFTYDYISQPSSGVIATYREENGWVVCRVMKEG